MITADSSMDEIALVTSRVQTGDAEDLEPRSLHACCGQWAVLL
jgi:hypothetical protein